MSHPVFKKQLSFDEEKLRRLARQVPDQEALNRILDQADDEPGMRAAVFNKIRSFLSFGGTLYPAPQPAPDVPFEPAADCAQCGRRRGSVIPHACH